MLLLFCAVWISILGNGLYVREDNILFREKSDVSAVLSVDLINIESVFSRLENNQKV